MTTERDRYNQLVFAEAKGVEKGRKEGMKEGFRLMVEQLRKTGMPEEEIERMVKEAEKA